MGDPNFIADSSRRLFTGLSADISAKSLSFEAVRYQICQMMGARYLCDRQKQKVIDLFMIDGEKNGRPITAAIYDVKNFVESWSTKSTNFPVTVDVSTIPKTIICRNEDGSLVSADLSASMSRSVGSKATGGPTTVYLNVVEVWLSWYNVQSY